jgi:hypothetical protein
LSFPFLKNANRFILHTGNRKLASRSQLFSFGKILQLLCILKPRDRVLKILSYLHKYERRSAKRFCTESSYLSMSRNICRAFPTDYLNNGSLSRGQAMSFTRPFRVHFHWSVL